MTAQQFKQLGGTPITPELAVELRQLVFGTSAIPMRAEWTQTPFSFGSVREEFSYGLRSSRNATRGLLSVVQGFILKHLLFGRKTSRAPNMADPLLPSLEMQKESLLVALLEILRSIADKSEVVVVLPSPEDECFVEHSATYFHDGITEKVLGPVPQRRTLLLASIFDEKRLYLFTLNPNEELEFFLKRYLKIFTEEDTPGTLLFLYSAVLTRSLGKLRNDLDSTKAVPLTMSNIEEGSLMIVTLLLTGRATPYIHNGVINVGDENSYASPQYGILKRCAIGLLLWESESSALNTAVTRQPGSRLKTPNYPIWVTLCAGHYGVMFNKNAELLRNYHAESRFDLYYYSCSGREIAMIIDNRVYNDQASGMLESQQTSAENTTALAGRYAKDEGTKEEATNKDETIINTPLQKLVHTKWEEAHIKFNVQLSMLSYLFTTQQ